MIAFSSQRRLAPPILAIHEIFCGHEKWVNIQETQSSRLLEGIAGENRFDVQTRIFFASLSDLYSGAFWTLLCGKACPSPRVKM